jgi:hypothetical protein
LVWATIAAESGFGAPRHDPIEVGRKMDVAISGLVGTQLPALRKRKALLADVMGVKIRNKPFCAAWDQLKDHKFRLASKL